MAKKKTDEDEGKRVPLSPSELLAQHNENVDKIYRVWSPGDSDFGPYETILYVTAAGVARTAVLVDDTLVMRDGWNLFYVQCYRAT